MKQLTPGTRRDRWRSRDPSIQVSLIPSIIRLIVLYDLRASITPRSWAMRKTGTHCRNQTHAKRTAATSSTTSPWRMILLNTVRTSYGWKSSSGPIIERRSSCLFNYLAISSPLPGCRRMPSCSWGMKVLSRRSRRHPLTTKNSTLTTEYLCLRLSRAKTKASDGAPKSQTSRC